MFLSVTDNILNISLLEQAKKELKNMIENGLDKFDRGQKIK
jgi:hypothetical protein